MFENEEVDANSPAESSSADSVEQQSQVQESSTQEQETPPPAQREVPFHEHPRFQELVKSNREYQSRAESLERYKAELESTVSQLKKQMEEVSTRAKGPSEEEQLVARLKGIDPTLSKVIEDSLQRSRQFEELTSQLEEMREAEKQRQAASQREMAMQQLSKLHEEHKVPEPLKNFYQSEVIRLAQSDPRLQLRDLPNLYKQVHEQMSKFLDGYKRDDRKQYVTDVRKDAATPPTGSKTAPAPGKSGKVEIPKGVDASEYLRAQIAKAALAKHNAASEV